jgi:hypothetical protein
MSYTNLPGVKANYIDGAFFNRPGSNQPRILILGVAEKGDSYKLFRTFNPSEATREFGEKGSMIQRMFEAYSEGADNVFLMRIGGTGSTLTITASDNETLTITTTQTGDDSGDRFALFLGEYDGDQRVLIWDLDDSSWVFDSHELAVINNGDFEVELSSGWTHVFKVGATVDSTSGLNQAGVDDTFETGTMSQHLTFSEWDAGLVNYATAGGVEFENNSATISTHVLALGADGINADGECTLSNPELYIALEKAYRLLDFQYTDIVIPCDVYLDVPSITDMSLGSDPAANNGETRVWDPDYTNLPVKGSSDDVLGYFWKYRKGGDITYAMSKVKNPGSYYASVEIAIQDTATTPLNGVVTIESASSVLDTAEHPIQVTISSTASGTGHSASENAAVSPKTVTINIDNTVAISAALLEAAIQGLAAGITLVDLANATVSADAGFGAIAASTFVDTIVAAPYMLTHEQLTGETASARGLAKLAESVEAEWREINFGHQLASFCHAASTNWKTLTGLISYSPVEGGRWFNGRVVGDWLGATPDYITIGGRLALDNIDDNGSGILGNKFMAGAIGYRYRELEGGTTSDGLAYGGFILTRGGSLPNPGEAYGIDQSDEAKDEKGFPIDLGKYIMVTGAWPRLTNGYDSGRSYRAPITGLVAGRLATIPEYQAPIGPVNGSVAGVSHWNSNGLSTSIANEMLGSRITTLASRTPNQTTQYYFAGMKTAAHPDSDYSNITTIRCVNRILQGIRDVGEAYIGNSFTSLNLISLQTALAGYLKGEEQAGYHQGASFQLSYTRQDRIMGRLNIQLKMIPPFSIEAITVNVTLAADQTGLA